VAVMGPSGCGKSTLLNVVGMIDSPSSGEYYFDGEEVGHRSENELVNLRKENIGFIFQNFNLIDDLTVYENVDLPLLYMGLGKAERRHRDAEPAERLRLAIEANDSAGALDVLRPLTLVEARAAAAKAGLVVPDEVRTKTGLYRAVEQQQREPAKGRIDPAGGPLEEKPLPLARRPAAEPAAAKRKGADRER